VWDVPDELLGPLVIERLLADDVRRKGFVLSGFPNSAKQAKMLAAAGVWVRASIYIDHILYFLTKLQRGGGGGKSKNKNVT